MNVYLLTDIEGVAGVSSHALHSYPDGKYYEEARQRLTREVNAAVDGLISADVKKVLVADAHGPGGICFDLLHPQALLLHGRPITREQLLSPVWEYDAVAMIGQHARAGISIGNQNHTFDSRKIDWMKINDQEVGETLYMAIWAGLKGVPVIFLSGDEAACREAETDVPGIVTAAVKQGLGANSEITLSAQASQALIRERIQFAVEAHRKTAVSPIQKPAPYSLAIRWVSTQLADEAESASGCERLDGKTTRYCSTEMLDVLRRLHRPAKS
jgi:D-amino peptidase